MTTMLSAKGQIVIPTELRERKGFKPGDEFEIEEMADSLVIRKKQRNQGLVAHLQRLKGTALKPGTMKGTLKPARF
ncbi:MAG: AbrB/MazE/SpoVT family DNA-binding domain-containing protein [Verrucomicrobia bacterium]|nr:AbrB/MazE/SpoVT family DNA-binding domain-containing protein [Verrucomicrobiota bacterium]